MIKNLLLTGAIMSTPALLLNAETKVYTMDNLGDEVHVANNGKYCAVGDYSQKFAYVWSLESPDEFTLLSENSVSLDVDDNGTVVGYMLSENKTVSRPCIWENGVRQELPVHAHIVNEGEANCISPDGKVIAGTQFINDPTSPRGGKYYPCIWRKGDDGKWNLTSYDNITLPKHQGFLTKCLYLNGDDVIIGGRMYTELGSTVPAMIINGELKYWNKLETKLEPAKYKDSWIGTDPITGEQIFVDSLDDPRINLYEEYYVDGYHDTTLAFDGELTSVDTSGNFYGKRTRVLNVDESGDGDLIVGAVIYNYLKDEWTDDSKYDYYGTGIDDARILFTLGDKIIIDGVNKQMSKEFGFKPNREFNAVMSVSDDGKVIGAMTKEYTEAIQGYQYYPLMIVLDEPLVDTTTGIESVTTEDGVTVIVTAGRIDVAGASEVAVYDLGGKLVGTASTTYVQPGIYIVKAGDTTRKVVVK